MNLEGKIVFSSGRLGDYDIWSLNLETKEIKQLTSGQYWNDCPRWSPDGEKIIFISNRNGIPNIYLMNEDGSDQKKITNKDRWHNTPYWSPDGEKIVFCANYGGNLDIYTMNLDGSDLKQITNYEDIDSTPQYSPDGKNIIFTSQRSGNDDIWTYNLESDEFKQLTAYEYKDTSPTYSPDGSHIAFVCGEISPAGENLEIYVMDRDGQHRTRITHNSGTDRYVSWSPAGKFLIYTSSHPNSAAERIKVIDIETMKAKQVNFNRKKLDREIDSVPKGIGIFALLPKSLVRKIYPESYFGTERYPDWKW